MAQILKQNQNVHVTVGPLVDKSDAVTPVTSPTIADITVALIRGGARSTITLADSGDNEFTHLGDGYFIFDLTGTNANTLGHFRVTFRDDDVFLPAWEDFFVLAPKIFDSLVANTDKLEVDAVEIEGKAAIAEIRSILQDELKNINDPIEINSERIIQDVGILNEKVPTDLLDNIATAIWGALRSKFGTTGSFGEGVNVVALNAQAKQDVADSHPETESVSTAELIAAVTSVLTASASKPPGITSGLIAGSPKISTDIK